jgi:hypothetical protein
MQIKTEIKWAAMLWMATLLWMVFEKGMGWHSSQISKHALFTNLYDIGFIVFFVFALKDKRTSDYGGKMDWKQGFVSGLVITILMTAISPLTQLIIHRIISPEFFPNMIKYAVENGFLGQEQAESTFNLKSYILQNLFGTMTLGVVASAIGAYFTKKA